MTASSHPCPQPPQPHEPATTAIEHRFSVHRMAGAFRSDAGQTTAEYALVLLGVAAIAMLLLAWAQRTDTLDGLFDDVLESLRNLVP